MLSLASGAQERDCCSVGLAARRNRPERFDFAVAHADIPVVHIASWIAVSGHKTQLLVDFEHALRVFDNAVLIRAFDVFDVVTGVDEGETGVD
jgi:hypothetical protein